MQARVDKLVHDVRGVLNTISMNAELARLLSQQPHSQDEESQQKIQQCLRVILSECGLCNSVVEDFRTAVRSGLDTMPDTDPSLGYDQEPDPR